MLSCSIRPHFPHSHGVPSLWLFTVFPPWHETPHAGAGRLISGCWHLSQVTACPKCPSLACPMAGCSSVPSSVGCKGNVLWARKPPRSCTRATWGASREVQGEGGECHVLGQSVPISTMASALRKPRQGGGLGLWCRFALS